jgi:hypothetical protein
VEQGAHEPRWSLTWDPFALRRCATRPNVAPSGLAPRLFATPSNIVGHRAQLADRHHGSLG